MKKILITLLLLSSFLAIQAQGIFGSEGNLEPLGPYGIVWQEDIKGGLHVLSDTAVLPDYLKSDAMVFQTTDSTFYYWTLGQWKNGGSSSLSGLTLQNAIVNNPKADARPIFSRGIYLAHGDHLGRDTAVMHEESAIVGYGGQTTNRAYVSLGGGSWADQYGSIALGFYAHALGNNSVAFQNSSATGIQSFSLNNAQNANGDYSLAANRGTAAVGDNSAAFGVGNQVHGYGSFGIGIYSKETWPVNSSSRDPNNPLFVIGNGTGSSLGAKNNAFLMLTNGTSLIDTTWSYKSKMTGHNFTGLQIPTAEWVLNNAGGGGLTLPLKVSDTIFKGPGGQFINQTDSIWFRLNRTTTQSNFETNSSLTVKNSLGFLGFNSNIRRESQQFVIQGSSSTWSPKIHLTDTSFYLRSFAGEAMHVDAKNKKLYIRDLNFVDANNAALTSGQALVSNGTSMIATNVSETIGHTQNIDFPSIPAHSDNDQTFTVTGAAEGDNVIVTPDKGAAQNSLQYMAWVNGPNTIAIRAINYTTAAIDPGAENFYIKIVK